MENFPRKDPQIIIGFLNRLAIHFSKMSQINVKFDKSEFYKLSFAGGVDEFSVLSLEKVISYIRIWQGYHLKPIKEHEIHFSSRIINVFMK